MPKRESMAIRHKEGRHFKNMSIFTSKCIIEGLWVGAMIKFVYILETHIS